MKTTEELRTGTRPDPKGLDVRERPRLRHREKCFLLTPPFIEPARDYFVKELRLLSTKRLSAQAGEFRSLWIVQQDSFQFRVKIPTPPKEGGMGHPRS